MFKFDENAVLEALVIENFLERSASQLTYHGLSELTTSMEDDEIGVLFPAIPQQSFQYYLQGSPVFFFFILFLCVNL
jgi:hypothetical protein